jgi:hypothetical protein
MVIWENRFPNFPHSDDIPEMGKMGTLSPQTWKSTQQTSPLRNKLIGPVEE